MHDPTTPNRTRGIEPTLWSDAAIGTGTEAELLDQATVLWPIQRRAGTAPHPLHHVVVAYDIASDRSRGKAFKVLSAYGRRIQRSVFEVRCTEHQLDCLIHRLRPLIDESSDDLRAFPRCTRCAGLARGIGSCDALVASPLDALRDPASCALLIA